jgi:hypothetical protein
MTKLASYVLIIFVFLDHYSMNKPIKKIVIISGGESSTQTLKRLFGMINVEESQWVPCCNATYKVNIRFNGLSAKSGIKSYSHSFTSQVNTFTSRPFIHNCRTRRLALATHTQLKDFFLMVC